MSLTGDLTQEVIDIFKAGWTEQESQSPPNPTDLLLNSNHAKHLKSATVLYADIDASTSMVDNYKWSFSAEVYKAFLRCAAAVIRSEGGAITAYDGDRVMAVFVGELKNTTAVRTALKINWAVTHIVQIALKNQYPTTAANFELKHVVGIETSSLHAARVGVHGDNDIVWVGRAANHAAKLCALSKHRTWITKSVYDAVADTVKLSNGTNMWTQYSWDAMSKSTIYGTDYWWSIP